MKYRPYSTNNQFHLIIQECLETFRLLILNKNRQLWTQNLMNIISSNEKDSPIFNNSLRSLYRALCFSWLLNTHEITIELTVTLPKYIDINQGSIQVPGCLQWVKSSWGLNDSNHRNVCPHVRFIVKYPNSYWTQFIQKASLLFPQVIMTCK